MPIKAMKAMTGKPMVTDSAIREREIPEMLRRLGGPLGDTRWRRQFHLFQETLTGAGQVHPGTPAIIPGLLALAQLQTDRRAEYLAFLELCQAIQPREAVGEAGFVERIHAGVAAGEDRYREFVLTDLRPGVRAAAARILRRCPGLQPETCEALSRGLAFEKVASVQAEILAALHCTESPRVPWAHRLDSYLTAANPPEVRLRAACSRLACRVPVSAAGFDLIVDALARALYHQRGEQEYPAPALALIQAAATFLHRQDAIRLWSALLPAAREFDGAIDMSLHLLRAAFQDQREGWQEISLSVRHRNGKEAEPPGLFQALARLAWAGVHHRFTGRFPTMKLRRHHRPARDYIAIRAFPPALDLRDAGQLRALEAIVNTPAAWAGFTNLWTLFGLPSKRLELQLLLDADP